MYNEYVIVAALAKRAEIGTGDTKATEWWNRFIGNDGAPSGMETHGYPKYATYNGHNTLCASKHWFTSSFVIQETILHIHLLV